MAVVELRRLNCSAAGAGLVRLSSLASTSFGLGDLNLFLCFSDT